MTTLEPPLSRASPVYLDCNASTPIDPEALDVVSATMAFHGNPASQSHRAGRRLGFIVEQARRTVAAPLDRDPNEVYFTSGATESNNLALLGTAGSKARHIVTTSFEHASVRSPIDALEASGWAVTRLSAGPDGRVSALELAQALRPDTALVSVMEVNNETGAVQPIAEIVQALRGHHGNALLHVDASQGFTKTRPRYEGIDLLSVSGHKLHGPVGVGALLVGERAIHRLEPLMHGGHQQGGVRPGTLPAALVAGFARAVELGFEQRTQRLGQRRRFGAEARAALTSMGAVFNLVTPEDGDGGHGVRHASDSGIATTLSVRFPGLDADVVMMRLEAYAAMSRGSACSGSSQSHVLEQLGLSPQQVQETLRISWSHMTPTPDWDGIAQVIDFLRKA